MIPALRAARAALAYYTILPVDRRLGDAPDAAALPWLPPIGGAVGAAAGAVAAGCAVWLHVPWAFVVAWALTIALTGAIHVDGFLDACDGLFVSASPQRRREILKDPHHGTYALTGMAIAGAFWLAALAAIAPQRYPLVLAFSGAGARLAAIVQARIFGHAPTGSMAESFTRGPAPWGLALDVALVETLAWFVAPWALAVAPAVTLLAAAAGWWSARRLGGFLTGDCYGALIVVCEIAILLALR